MGKRSNYKHNERNYYPTPYSAVIPLLKFINNNTFIEPCAGDGRLIDHLEKHGHKCVYACDIEPLREDIEIKDVLFFEDNNFPISDYIITNPPWEREVLHKMIEKFRVIAQTWLLFDASWMHTSQAKTYIPYCDKIVNIGRVKWVENSKNSGMEDACWYLFQKDKVENTKYYL